MLKKICMNKTYTNFNLSEFGNTLSISLKTELDAFNLNVVLIDVLILTPKSICNID